MGEKGRPPSSIARHPSRIRVEVAYALPDEQALIAIEMEEGARVREAIERSGILRRFPGIKLARGRVGIFGRQVEFDAPLSDGDRVEIYRPLAADPKEIRRERAARRKRAQPRARGG
jgi:hypothetical protein